MGTETPCFPLPVIVNADDFGISPRISRCIAEVAEAGSLTSISICVCSPYREVSMEIWFRSQALSGFCGAGLHLTLTDLYPVHPETRKTPLVHPETGRFHSRFRLAFLLLTGQIRLEWVEQELEAQWEWLERTGISPDHIDGHQHVHYLPGIWEVVLRFARQKGVGVRVPVPPPLGFRGNPGRFLLSVLGKVRHLPPGVFGNTWLISIFDRQEALPSPTLEDYRHLVLDLHPVISGQPLPVVEWMLHPFVLDEEDLPLYPMVSARRKRFFQVCAQEYEFWRNQSFRDWLSRHGNIPFRFITYRQIPQIRTHG